MERISVRKNVLMGFVLINWVLALVLFLTDRRNYSLQERKIFVSSFVVAAMVAICGIIPFVGWACSIAVTVFWIIGIVQMFKGNFDYEMILVSKLVNAFVKE